MASRVSDASQGLDQSLCEASTQDEEALGLSLPPDDQPGDTAQVPVVIIDPRYPKRLTEPKDLAELTNDHPFVTVGMRVYEPDKNYYPHRKA